MRGLCAFSTLLLALLDVPGQASTCKEHKLDFILLAGDPLMAQIEDDVRKDLEKIGVKVNTRLLEKADFNAAMQSGDFHLCFTESWGPPYDPHSFAAGWFRENNEAHFKAMETMEAPMTRAKMEEKVREVLTVENEVTRQDKWTAILQEMHNQAISNPMWSRKMPAVWNKRLTGYEMGPQQFDYPMHTVEVLTGSNTVTVAPGAQTGLFVTTGPMDPHSYRPNEFFISNWIYEGLVSYGAGGVIKPMLATSWTVAASGSGEEYKFQLRSGVKFHDGADFNCAAVKMNFDHVLQPPLNTVDYHGWYDLARHTQSWSCSGEVFTVKLSQAYYPFLQELSLIRPIRMLSPNSFKNGASTDPKTHNSCPEKWKSPGGKITCVGVSGTAGTGPWIYNKTTTRADSTISEVLFLRNRNHWAYATGTVDQIKVVNYATADAVKAALLDESLDMVVGGGVLTPAHVKEIRTSNTDKLQVIMGPELMNQIIVMNAAKAPTSDIQLRKIIMHAVNKAAIVADDLKGQGAVADSLFPKDAPYCNVDLSPRWDYDLEKAKLMNCPATTVTDATKDDGGDTGMILGIVIGVAVVLILAVAAGCFFFGKKAGYNELGAKQPKGNTGAQQGTPAVIGSEQNQA